MKNQKHVTSIGDVDVSKSDSYVFVKSYGDLKLCFSRIKGDGLEKLIDALQATLLECPIEVEPAYI